MRPDPLPELLAPFLAEPRRAGVLTDFDGTLAPIVDRPDDARPLPGVREVLGRLADRYRQVAVVSGRPVAFLQAHLGQVTGLTLAGLYGMQTVRNGASVELPEAAAWRTVVEEVAARAEADRPEGTLVERKELTVTLHFRTAPEAAQAARAWAEAEAARTGLVPEPARMSWELRPPVEADKGIVVERLAAGLAAVCFLGDDRGDLAAFDALDRLATGGACILRVGVRSREAPVELLDRADVLLDGPEASLGLLRRLLG